MKESGKERLKNFLDEAVRKGIPSVDCIVYKDHKEVFRYMTGNVDIDGKVPVYAGCRYLMFSMTKVMTMTAVLQLIEKGKLSLEDEVGKYLEAYKDIKVKKADGSGTEDLKHPMKIKHLVSMQSGLDYDLGRAGILRVLKEKGQKATTRELVDAFAETPLDFQPGEHYAYSLSHDVIGAIIEAVSGMSFGEYLKKNIWEPLELKDTFFAKPDNTGLERLAQQFTSDEKGVITPMDQSCCYQLSESYESGGAGLVSTTEDYMKLGDALACGGEAFNGKRILKPETVDIMKTNLLCDASMDEIARNMGRTGYGYGCGVQVLLHPEMIGSPAKAGVFGWDGAAGSLVQMDKDTKTSVVYTMHVRGCGMAYGVIHPGIRDIVFEA